MSRPTSIRRQATTVTVLVSLFAMTGAQAQNPVPQYTPNDPYFELQWNLDAPIRAGGEALTSPLDHPDADIDMPEAWDLWNRRARTACSSDDEAHTRGEHCISGSSEKLAYVVMVSSGIQCSHEDLAGLVINPGEDANGDHVTTSADANNIDDDGNGMADDRWGFDFNSSSTFPCGGNTYEGTAVGGLIAARTNNALGIAGVSGPNSPVRLISTKIYGSAGTSSYYAWAAAVNYLIDLKLNRSVNIVAVYNGIYQGALDGSDGPVRDRLRNAGILLVTSPEAPYDAGTPTARDGWDIDSREKYAHKITNSPLDNILVVTASDRQGRLARWADYGPASVDVAAPGEGILTTAPADPPTPIFSYTFGSSYAGLYDTTFTAAAQVTGLAALLWSYDPFLRVDDPDPDGDGPLTGKPSYLKIKERIMNTVVKDPSLEGKTVTGGRINAWRALANRTDLDP